MRIIFMMDNKTPPKGKGSMKSSKGTKSKKVDRGSKKGQKRPLSSSLKISGQPSVNKTVTWRGMESYGYAAVMDTIPGQQKKAYINHNTGTLGSGTYNTEKDTTSEQYTQDVKMTFAKKPAIYREFVQILSEVRNPESDKVEIVKRVIMLFDGYPHLIVGFNAFLPRNIRLEIQADAVIVKVDEDDDGAFGEEDSDEDEDTPTMRYIRNVKWTYTHHPGVYDQFSKVLKNFHKKSSDEVDTIHKIVALFQDHPDLVLGFNFFLPDGFKILAHKKHGYVIQHPCKKGLKPHYTPVNVEETYLD